MSCELISFLQILAFHTPRRSSRGLSSSSPKEAHVSSSSDSNEEVREMTRRGKGRRRRETSSGEGRAKIAEESQ